MLYRTSEGSSDVLLLSAHGGYFLNSGDVPIPEGLTLSFLGPHTRELRDPGVGLIHDDNWLPFAELSHNSEVLHPYKNKAGAGIPHEQVKGDPQMIYGADSAGLVKNYRLYEFDGLVESKLYSTETPEIIAKAIDENRIKESVPNTDILTVKPSYSEDKITQLSDVFALLETKEELKGYKKLIFSACRVDMEIGPSPRAYALKSKQIVIAEKTPTGWAIKGIVPVPAALDTQNKQPA